MAAELERALAEGVKAAKVPHAIVFATNRDGSFYYKHATGYQHYGIDDDPIREDALLMLASQSKILTAISALKAVELGFIGLDDDVTPHLPELGNKKILTGFDADDTPILVERKNPITLRQLLSHSSGTSYGMDPNTTKYAASQKKTDPMTNLQPTVIERYDTPLVFEPGTSWLYSPGLDWTGNLLLRLTGLTLEDASWKARHQPQLTVRTPEGSLAPFTQDTINTHSTDCFGGHGVYAQLSDYTEVLRSLLANDSRLLTPASVEELFRPQLGEAATQALATLLHAWHGLIPGEIDLRIPVSYSLGGLVYLEHDVGRRRKGTMSWGGMFNPFWIVDREAGLAYAFGTQVLPPGDAGCKELSGVAERAVYKMAGLA